MTTHLGVWYMRTSIVHDKFHVFGFDFYQSEDVATSTEFDLSSTTSHATYTGADAVQKCG